MKKRKAPIVLISILIICGLFAVILNIPHDDQQKPETADLTALPDQARKAPTKDVFSRGETMYEPNAKKSKPAPGPLVAVQTPGKAAASAPTGPSPTSVQGQWYLPEHAATPTAH